MIQILRSQVATLAVLSLALLAQLPHAAEVFMIAGASHGWLAWLHGLAYAVALELAVLLFVVQERRSESYGFAIVSVLVNLAYYAERVSLFSVQALPAWLISLALPIAIALYSHAIAGDSSVVEVPRWLRNLWHDNWLRTAGEVPQAEKPQPLVLDVVVGDNGCASDVVALDDDTQAESAQLDDLDTQVVAAVRAGHTTAFAISKVVDASLTTLKRRKQAGSEEYIGRIPALVERGVLRNSSGAGGNEYRLAEGWL
jgi:hypothetical protein